jgi:hypothetical protein
MNRIAFYRRRQKAGESAAWTYVRSHWSVSVEGPEINPFCVAEFCSGEEFQNYED